MPAGERAEVHRQTRRREGAAQVRREVQVVAHRAKMSQKPGFRVSVTFLLAAKNVTEMPICLFCDISPLSINAIYAIIIGELAKKES